MPVTNFHANINKLYAFSFLQKTLFPMAIITLFWKDHIGLNLTEILLLQSIFSAATVVLEYPSGYISDRLGYRNALTIAAVLGTAGWGIYTWPTRSPTSWPPKSCSAPPCRSSAVPTARSSMSRCGPKERSGSTPATRVA